MAQKRCDLCGEAFRLDRNGEYAEEVGEFWDGETDSGSVIAHAQCGLSAGMVLA